MITIIGLGNDPEDLSLRAHRAILAADEVLAKTSKVRAFDYFERNGVACGTLDEIFGRSRSFSSLYKNLGAEVVRRARGKNLCYCVEGSGADDRSAAYILEKCRDAVLLPAAESGAALLAKGGSASHAVYAAYDFASAGYLEIDRSVPLLIREIDTPFLASEVKLKLFESYPEETEVLFSDGGDARKISLFELDRQQNLGCAACVLLLPEEIAKRRRFGFADLVNIVRRLRAPGGCPWDRAQDHDSIRMNLLEEAYEALEAVELADSDKMCEEMGDLLLQSVFHAIMGEETGEFSTADMLSELCFKLVFRHSHIFGGERAEGSEEALKVWERNKNIEKNQHSISDEMRDVPKNFPALLYACKIQKKAKKGTDLPDPSACFEKLEEEIAELRAVDPADAARVDDEGGDVLFAAVNVLRQLHAEPELALRHAAEKFAGRFSRMEAGILAEGRTFGDFSADELEEKWRKSKI